MHRCRKACLSNPRLADQPPPRPSLPAHPAAAVNGYEGTGRSLSLKLIQQLRQQVRGFDCGGAPRQPCLQPCLGQLKGQEDSRCTSGSMRLR